MSFETLRFISMPRMWVFFVIINTIRWFGEMDVYSLKLSDNCDKPLGMENNQIPDAWLTASSSHDTESVGPHNARLNLDQNGGAWCPDSTYMRLNTRAREASRRQTSIMLDDATLENDEFYQYLQVNFQKNHVVTRVQTQGRFGKGNGQEFAEHYKLDYLRDNDVNGKDAWHHYRDAKGSYIINANNDTMTIVSVNLNPPIIASKIRIVPYNLNPRTVCMRIELHGCIYNEGLVSYTAPRGNTYVSSGKDQIVDLSDKSYDGFSQLNDQGEIMRGGMGQLFDGHKGGNNFLRDYAGLGPGYEWIGWKRSKEQHNVDLIFHFDNLRNFSTVTFNTNNMFDMGVRVFKKAKILFSSNGHNFSMAPKDILIYTYTADNLMTFARAIVIKLNYKVAKSIKITLDFASTWILISEVEFTSTEISDLKIIDITEKMELPQNTKSKMVQIDIYKFVLLGKIMGKNPSKIPKSFVFDTEFIDFPLKVKPVYRLNQANNTLVDEQPVTIVANTKETLLGGNKKINKAIIITLSSFVFSLMAIIMIIFGRNYYLQNKLVEKKVIYNLTLGMPFKKAFFPGNNSQNTPKIHGQHGTQNFTSNNNSSYYYQQAPIVENSDEITHYSCHSQAQANSPKLINLIMEQGNDPSQYAKYEIKNPAPPRANINRPPVNNILKANEDLIISNHPTLRRIIYPDSMDNDSTFNMNNTGKLGFDNRTFVPSPYLAIHDGTASALSFAQAKVRDVFEDTSSSSDDCYGRYSGKPFFNISKSLNFHGNITTQTSNVLMPTEPRSPINPYAAVDLFQDAGNKSQLTGICGNSVYTLKHLLSYGDYQRIIVPLPKISYENLIINQKIGEGSYGELYTGEMATPSEGKTKHDIKLAFVIKMMRNSNNNYKQTSIEENWLKEIYNISKIKHPNICGLLALTHLDENDEDITGICIVQEFCKNGDLYQFLSSTHSNSKNNINTSTNNTTHNNKNYCSYENLLSISSQIASGMKYLENQNIAHGDLATRNCLVTDNNSIKITDIAMSQSIYADDYCSIPWLNMTHDKNVPLIGKINQIYPIRWMPWESLINGEFTPKSDVWAFGVTLWEIMSLVKDKPFQTLDNSTLLQMALNEECCNKLQKPDICSKEIYDLISQCMERDIAARPTFHEIYLFLLGKIQGRSYEQILKGNKNIYGYETHSSKA